LQASKSWRKSRNGPGAGQAPNIGGLHVAMVQGAVYDAVNMIDGGHKPYLDGLPSAPPDASKAAAVATAACTLPSQQLALPTPPQYPYSRPSPAAPQQAACNIYHLFDSTKLRLPPQPRKLLLASSLSGRENVSRQASNGKVKWQCFRGGNGVP
jgi:hypothetical protein